MGRKEKKGEVLMISNKHEGSKHLKGGKKRWSTLVQRRQRSRQGTDLLNEKRHRAEGQKENAK